MGGNGMSNSSSSSELFQLVDEKDSKVAVEFNNILLRSSTLEFNSSDDHGCLIASSSLSQQQNKKDGKCEGGGGGAVVVNKMRDAAAARTRTRTRTLAGELEADADDDDGFRTPTSLDHRIPAIQQCPPAPRKPKSSPKRKASSSSSSSSSTRRQLFLLDLSQEIESLFPPALLADLGRKIKKIRRGDDDTN
ncbi:cyclin-dependent protein kinase inhibitor SMR3-like [Telopea speciosissima]|uniref:cyclin-dependent protein kinase inhibitor SMR3-like n=1 Tax=Telopea speciosissima TaxID=54955 RepID=UPI001CC63F7E|nr:cyclin-dependent protein kinase inhibitor SMR3-like [Telopea speciosissima]